MPVRVRRSVAVLSALLVSACGRSALQAGALPGEAEARAASGKVAVLVKDVIPYGFATGKPTGCAVIYDVFNNGGARLDGASLSIAGYPFPIAGLPPRTEYSDDQSITVAPLNGSCAGVADALASDSQSLSASRCSIEGVSPDDCSSMFTAIVGIDQDASDQIRQAEQTAAKAYAAQLAAAFAQAKAQAWAKRGPYQVAVGGGFVEANPAAPVLISGVTAPDFDPTKTAQASADQTTDFKLCAPNPNDATDQTPGKLAVLAETKDPYGLADWYRLRLSCSGHPDHFFWLKAAVVEHMLAAGQVTKQAKL